MEAVLLPPQMRVARAVVEAVAHSLAVEALKPMLGWSP